MSRTLSAAVPMFIQRDEIKSIQIDEKNRIKTLLATETEPKNMTVEDILKTCSGIRNGSGGYYQLVADSSSYKYNTEPCTVISIRESAAEDAKLVGIVIVNDNGYIVRVEVCTGHFLSNMKTLQINDLKFTKEGAAFTMPKIIIAQRNLAKYSPQEFKDRFEPHSPMSAEEIYEQEQLKLEKAFSEFDITNGKDCQKAGRNVRWGLLFDPADVKQEHNIFDKFSMLILAAIHARLLNETPEGVFLSLVFQFAHPTDFAIIERNTFCGDKDKGGDTWGYWLNKDWTMTERIETLEKDGVFATNLLTDIPHDDRLHSWDRLQFLLMSLALDARKFGLSMAVAFYQDAIFGKFSKDLSSKIEFETSISLSCTTAKAVLPGINKESSYISMNGLNFKEFALSLNEPSVIETDAKRARTFSGV